MTETRGKQLRANVIGAGPNGLAAAIVLAQAGLAVDVYEAEAVPGGAARTLELTLPGFHHDFGSAVLPMAAASPFFQSLPLEKYGLEWVHAPIPLAHPLEDGRAVVLRRSLTEQQSELGEDGAAWKGLIGPFVREWDALIEDTLRPISLLPKHPVLMARFGARALVPAAMLARSVFRTERARALFAGLAAHSYLSLNTPLSAAVALVLGAAAHTVGWPFPRGGAQSLTNALIDCLQMLGGKVHLSQRVTHLEELPPAALNLCDVTPWQLVQMAGERLSPAYRDSLKAYRLGPGAFKVDYALSEPIPWKAKECGRAGTVHIGGSLDEIAASESAMSHGRISERPFVLLAQPTNFDPSRAPAGKHIAWAYCHVPNGFAGDMTAAIESQIERFAPGFRDCVLTRSVLSPARLEAMDANLIGGDISGGAMDALQFLLRPTWRYYGTSAPDLFLCSSSTPPGGGVHGMCGYNAAKAALRAVGIVE